MAHDDLLKEAANPATDPERLRDLANHVEDAVHRAAWRNPSLPEDAWRRAFLWGEPEAWANPMAPIYVLTWTPLEDDWRTIYEAALSGTANLRENPTRGSSEGKALIVAKMQEWWGTCESADDMMKFLGEWAQTNGENSLEHRKMVCLLVLCVRTAPYLTDKDRQALDLLEDWGRGGKDRRYEAENLAYSTYVQHTVFFAQNTYHRPSYALQQVLEKEGIERQKDKAEHNRLLADLIRREMPLPPVVE